MRRRALATAMMLVSAVAMADDPVARANTLFDEAKKLLDDGHVAEACARFDESYRLAPRGGTLLNLGLCHEREGKLLAARRELRDALAMARRDGRADREPVAREHLAAVEAKLAWLVVTPPPNVVGAGVEIRVDGAPIAPDDWSAVAVEPGRHVVAASAAGFRTREMTITLDTGARETVRFDALEPLAAAPPSASATTLPATPSAIPSTPPAPSPSHDVPPPPAPRSDSLRTSALVAGIAGVAISVATGAWALERKGVVSAECTAAKLCSQTGADAASTGRSLVVVSTVAFAIGAVGFGAWFLLPRADAPHAAQGIGFTAGGTF